MSRQTKCSVFITFTTLQEFSVLWHWIGKDGRDWANGWDMAKRKIGQIQGQLTKKVCSWSDPRFNFMNNTSLNCPLMVLLVASYPPKPLTLPDNVSFIKSVLSQGSPVYKKDNTICTCLTCRCTWITQKAGDLPITEVRHGGSKQGNIFLMRPQFEAHHTVWFHQRPKSHP